MNKQEERQKVLTKLSYKMPVTFRFGLISGFLGGCIHAIYAGKSRYMFTHTVALGLGLGLGLCYNDFYRLMEIQMKEE